jgi:hypothetical protein
VHLRQAKEGVDDLDKSASFAGGATPRRSTSSLGDSTNDSSSGPDLWGIFGGKGCMKPIEAIAKSVGWAWAVIAGFGGLVLLIHQGPLPITNGWFALLSGIASCPLTGSLVKRHTRFAVSIYSQLALALLIFLAGRVAVVIVLHRPFLPQCSKDCW